MEEGRDGQKERRKSMERRNGGGNCLADMNGWKEGSMQVQKGSREGGARERREKQQRRGMKMVHVCCWILRQLTAGEVVKREGREEGGIM